uniref:ribosomal protein L32 n=1 Tax=Myosurus minimus TaxID=59993 RepID=UPI0030DE415B
MTVSKKTFISKKHIRKNLRKNKAYWAALRAFYLAKSLSTGNSNFFLSDKQISNKVLA